MITMRKMIVSAARRMIKAISLGVFWRLAPSTRAIMWSMKLSPGSAVTRTTISSESTRVPPVTALRSPPDSRITGADSPVMADSSTVAAPSITSPSVGMISPAFMTMISFFRSNSAETVSRSPSRFLRLARVCVRDWRRVAAWALPRPSAMASAKLANNTVNHSQMAIWRINPAGSPRKGAAASSAVVTTAPQRVTNITGFRAMPRGSSFRKASAIA